MRILIDNERKLHPYMENIKSIAKGIYITMGNNSEVIIHDLGRPESSIVFIAGELTKRNLGSPVTDLVLETIRDNNNPEDILNYTSTTKNNRIFKSSTMFIRDEKSKVIGCLCTNYDITDIVFAQKILGDFSGNGFQNSNGDSNIKSKENFTSNIKEMLENIFNEALDYVGKPISYMNKEDNVKMVKFLDEKGVFAIKNSVEIMADYMNVSRYTIYNYLKEIK